MSDDETPDDENSDDEQSDDGGTFSIRLVNADGDPIENRSITVFYPGLIGSSTTEYTDHDGWAEFGIYGHRRTAEIHSYELYGILIQKRAVTISDGEEIHDGASFSFTIIDGD